MKYVFFAGHTSRKSFVRGPIQFATSRSRRRSMSRSSLRLTLQRENLHQSVQGGAANTTRGVLWVSALIRFLRTSGWCRSIVFIFRSPSPTCLVAPLRMSKGGAHVSWRSSAAEVMPPVPEKISAKSIWAGVDAVAAAAAVVVMKRRSRVR